jgi:hypothetical protein
VECGTTSASATVCEHCGATSFELARPVVSRPGSEPPLAELVSLQEARAEREKRRSSNDRD